MSNDEIEQIVQSFVEEKSIHSQREYERQTIGNRNVPSLDTLKKRFSDVKPLFKRNSGVSYSSSTWETTNNLTFSVTDNTIQEQIESMRTKDKESSFKGKITGRKI